APEQVSDHGDAVAHRAAEQIAHRPIERLALYVEAGHLDRAIEAGVAQVVDRSQDLELDELEVERVHADDARLELHEGGALIAAADFAKTDDPFISEDLQDRSQEV